MPEGVDVGASAATVELGVSQAVVDAVVLGNYPSDLALRFVEQLHLLGLPWWAAIAGSTVLVRSALLPIAIRTAKMQGKMKALQKEMAPFQARYQMSGGLDIEAGEKMQEIYNRHGVSPLRMILPQFAQLPIFFSFFMGLRRLAETFPDAHQGGILWFPDLGIPDTNYILPAISSASALALLKLAMPPPAPGASEQEQEMQDKMKMILGGLTLISFPVAVSMPCSVLVFWVSNNAYSITYSSSILLPSVREAMGLPPLPTKADYEAADVEAAAAAAAAAAAPVAASMTTTIPSGLPTASSSVAFTPTPTDTDSLQRAQAEARTHRVLPQPTRVHPSFSLPRFPSSARVVR